MRTNHAKIDFFAAGLLIFSLSLLVLLEVQVKLRDILGFTCTDVFLVVNALTAAAAVTRESIICSFLRLFHRIFKLDV